MNEELIVMIQRTCWVNSLPRCKLGPQEGILIEIEAYT